MRLVYIETGGSLGSTRIFDANTLEPIKAECIEFDSIGQSDGQWMATIHCSHEDNWEIKTQERVVIHEMKTVLRKIVCHDGVY